MLPLIPLVSLASSLVPGLIGLFGGKRAGELATEVAGAVRTVAGSGDLEQAARTIAADSIKAAELTAKLDEIRLRFAELQAQDAKDERATLLEQVKAEIADRDKARGGMVAALSIQGWAAQTVAMGPPVISALVVLGFLFLCFWLLRYPFDSNASQTTLTLLNVVVGAMVAGFTAVLNFWLGSSQGSRDKDRTVAALQAAQTSQTTETLRQVTNQAFETKPATPAPAAAGRPSRFDLCLPIVLAKEGGFSNHPHDPGGATNFGITQRTLAAWRRAEVTEADVRALSPQEAQEIYRAQYWNVMQCDAMPRGIDLMMFDGGVNLGPGRMVKLLQKAVGTAQDGGVGPFTLKATQSANLPALVETLSQARMDHYRDLPGFAEFGPGWTSRVEDIRRQALLMLG